MTLKSCKLWTNLVSLGFQKVFSSDITNTLAVQLSNLFRYSVQEEYSLDCSVKKRHLWRLFEEKSTQAESGEGPLVKAKSHLSLTTMRMYWHRVKTGESVSICVFTIQVWNSPEGLNDVGGDGSSSLVGIGLPGQRDAVLGHICDYGFVRRTWQLEGLCGLSYWWVCTLWMVGEQTEVEAGRKRMKREEEEEKQKQREEEGATFAFSVTVS